MKSDAGKGEVMKSGQGLGQALAVTGEAGELYARRFMSSGQIDEVDVAQYLSAAA